MASHPPSKTRVDDAEDDLEDLDDVISQFTPNQKTGGSAPPSSGEGSVSKVTLSAPASLPTSSTRTGQTRPRHNTRVDSEPPTKKGKSGGGLAATTEEDEIADTFAKELSKGMESLMRELVSPDKGEGSADAPVDEEAMKKAWEDMLVNGMNGLMSDPESSLGKEASGSTSDGKGTSSRKSADDEQDEGGRVESTDEFRNTPKADVERYELQLASVRRIVSVFDDPGYNESDSQTQLKIVEMMTEVGCYSSLTAQALTRFNADAIVWSPPQELMGDLPAAFGQDGSPDGCTIA
ncbi:Mitochondrial dicarboxylate transporter [Salix suchowensis]|nr:Mitochondrial dicarboxylate transporter [Salix suchowensis]